MSEPPSTDIDYFDPWSWSVEEIVDKPVSTWRSLHATRPTSSTPLDSGTAACRGCGRVRHVNPQRGHDDYCHTCQHLYNVPPMPDFTEARCVGYQEVSDLAHEPVNTPGAREARRKMLALCHACPIRQACLDWRMATETGNHRHGVWGGTTPTDRRRLAGEGCDGSAEEDAA